MYKHLIIFIPLLISLMGISQTKPISVTKSESATGVSQEIAEEIKLLEADIKMLEADIKKMTDPDELANAKEELNMLRQDLDMVKKMGGLMNNAQQNMKMAGLDPDAEERLVPKKDLARISAIPKTITDGNMGAYITSIQNKAASLLKPEVKEMAEKIYSYIKSNSKNSSEAGNMATGLWIAGKPEIAFHTLGIICVNDPANTDNMSNYASMLSMLGAQHLAIPILKNLNSKFPNNSTLLNNIGQAWFGLGDIDKSEHYLDSVIRIYANHPQANLTKSFIEESRGKKEAAVESAKRSINGGYTNEKENRLSKLGYDKVSKDIHWDKPMPQDPLGLEKFKWPNLPLNVEQSRVLEKEWDAFNEALLKEMNDLSAQEDKLFEAWETIREERAQELFRASQKGQYASLFPPLAYKAFVKLKYLVDDSDGHISFSNESKFNALMAAKEKIDVLEDVLENRIKTLNQNYGDQFGEGKANPFSAACADYNSAYNNFLSTANVQFDQAKNDYLEFLRRRLNDQIYYDQYTMWPEEFELAKVIAKGKWLGAIGIGGVFRAKSGYCLESEEELKPEKFKLQAFDDVACQYNATMDLRIVKITNNCSRMTSEFDFMFLSYVRKDDFERAEGDTYIGSTCKLSAEVGKELEAGPLKVEAKVGGGIELEFGTLGLEDVVLIGEAKVGAGTGVLDEKKETGSPGIGIIGKDAFPTTVEAGVEGRISIISGKGSASGTGILKDVKITE